MIVCSCNVVSDHEVHAAVTGGDTPPRTTGQVYGVWGAALTVDGVCARSGGLWTKHEMVK
jgi:bacterioferritin-associated ferredoxin